MGATMNGLPTGHAGLEIDEDHLRWVQSLAGVRLEILALLGAGPTPAGGLSSALDLDGTRVSKALAELRAGYGGRGEATPPADLPAAPVRDGGTRNHGDDGAREAGEWE